MVGPGIERGMRVLALSVASLLGCSSYEQCNPVRAEDLAALPLELSQTGLFVPGSEALAPGVRPYAPAFELWSDGATKRRWIWLPSGAAIDSSDVDDWKF